MVAQTMTAIAQSWGILFVARTQRPIFIYAEQQQLLYSGVNIDEI